MDYAIQLPNQLREHLRALRKERGLTQAALGRLLGVGQARIAEIENNPGVVSIDQLMRVLSALQTSLILRDEMTPSERHTAAKRGSDRVTQRPPHRFSHTTHTTRTTRTSCRQRLAHGSKATSSFG